MLENCYVPILEVLWRSPTVALIVSSVRNVVAFFWPKEQEKPAAGPPDAVENPRDFGVRSQSRVHVQAQLKKRKPSP